MLCVEGACKSYGAFQALAPTRLRVRAGQAVAIVGPSGCGKSTLMRLMVGLLRPDRGHIQFQQQQLTESVIQAARLKMGYVIQGGGLFPHLSAERNVSLPARHVGWSEARIAARVQQLAELAHFPTTHLSRYPVQLSGGQRQRVSFMRALMLDPDVLFLDEPLGALDPLTRSKLQIQLRELVRNLDKTVVLVTHDLAEASFLGDTIVLMRRGQIVQQGSLATLQQRPAHPFVTHFINAQRSALDALEQPDSA